MSCHKISNNGRKCFLELKGNFKTESYEKTKVSKSNAILKGSHYYGNIKFTLDNYCNLVVKESVPLEEAGTLYTFTEAHNINSFENEAKEPTSINFSITEKG